MAYLVYLSCCWSTATCFSLMWLLTSLHTTSLVISFASPNFICRNIPISLKHLLDGIMQIKADVSHCKNCIVMLDLLIHSVITKDKAIGKWPSLNSSKYLTDVEVFPSFILLLEMSGIRALLSNSVQLLTILNAYLNANWVNVVANPEKANWKKKPTNQPNKKNPQPTKTLKKLIKNPHQNKTWSHYYLYNLCIYIYIIYIWYSTERLALSSSYPHSFLKFCHPPRAWELLCWLTCHIGHCWKGFFQVDIEVSSSTLWAWQCEEFCPATDTLSSVDNQMTSVSRLSFRREKPHTHQDVHSCTMDFSLQRFRSAVHCFP